MGYIKLGFASLALTGLGGIVSFMIFSHSIHLDTSNQNSCKELETAAIQLRIENAQLVSDNHRLMDAMAAHEQRATSNAKTVTAIQINNPHPENTHREKETATQADPLVDASLQEATQNAIAKSKRFNEWLRETYKKSPHFDLGNEMSSRFAQEKVDANWAPSQEQTFMRLFSEDTNLAGTALKDVQCRATQCQLDIGITDVTQANDITLKLTQVLQTQDKNAFVIAAPDHQKGVTTLYIAKDENSFEFN